MKIQDIGGGGREEEMCPTYKQLTATPKLEYKNSSLRS